MNKQTYKPRLRLIVAKMSLMISSFFGSNDGMMFRRWMLQIFSSTWSCTIFWSSFRFSIEKNTSAHHTPSPHAPSKFRSWMLSMWWFRIAVRITFSCSSLSFDSAPHLSLPPPLMKLSTSMLRTLPHSRNAFSTSQCTPVKSTSAHHAHHPHPRHRHSVLMLEQFDAMNVFMNSSIASGRIGRPTPHTLLKRALTRMLSSSD